MQTPIQVSFREIEASAALEAACLAEAEKLERYCGNITSCRVVIARPHRHHRKGNLYEIRIDLHVPGEAIEINRFPPEHQKNEEVQVALHEAFQSVRRRLEDNVRRRRGFIKTHIEPPHGRIVDLNGFEGFGIIETQAGDRLPFLRNAVQGVDFEALELGTEVRFSQEQDPGSRVTSVRVVGRHHHLEP